jgi:CPA2 family monovalent cation:H+ antiporter-2
LLTLLLSDSHVSSALIQPLLAATVLSMAISPFLIRYNERVANFLMVRKADDRREIAAQKAAIERTERTDHVILCGFGRVGQNLARVLERQAIEYVALDMDSRRVRTAREAGDPVVYGDGAHAEILEAVGLATCRIVVITFAEPNVALGILRAVRHLRPDVPVLVRTQDDTYLDQLQKAGATEVVPETLEASLMLISHVLLLLGMPMSRVIKTVGDIRNNRYAMLRRLFRRDDARPLDETHSLREQLYSVSLPRRARAVGKCIGDLGLSTAGVTVTAVRRDGIVGHQPSAQTVLKEGDIVVLYGTPEALEHAESMLLMG